MVRLNAVSPGRSQAGFMEHTGTRSGQGEADAPEQKQGGQYSWADISTADREDASDSQNTPAPPSPAGAKRHWR